MAKAMAWVNAVLATIWTLVGVALIAQKVGQQSGGLLLVIVGIYALLVYIPANTAWTLFRSGPTKAAKAAVRLNLGLIVLGAISTAASFATGVNPAGVLVAPLLLMLPQWFSIKALNQVMLKIEQRESATAFPPIVAPD